jgi:hypothetical protein
MRSLIVCTLLAASAAYADPAPAPLPVDVVAKAKAGDWAVYEGWRLEAAGLVEDRVLARVVKPAGAKSPTVVWLRGAEGHEEEFYRYAASGAASTLLVGKDGVKGKVTVAADHCTLGKELACKRATFTNAADQSVALKMSDTVRATGIVELDITAGASVQWQLEVVAYGNDLTTEWSGAPGAAIAAVTADTPNALGGPSPVASPSAFTFGELKVSAGLDKAIVSRYLRRNREKLLYCYEKEQLAKPALARLGSATFSIGAAGQVTDAKAKGMDDAADGCVAEVISGIEFPKPSGDKPVTVTSAYSIAPAPAEKK